MKVLGTVSLWLEFGESQVQHRFLVLPMGVQAILGSDYFGTFGSTLNYDNMTFKLQESDTETCPLFERDPQPATVAQFSLGSRVAATTAQLSAANRSRAVVLEEDAWLSPNTSPDLCHVVVS